MKIQNLAPGMIFSLVDKMPANVPSAAMAEGKIPIHYYMVVSVGSEACLQDVQCMKITSMRNKESTYELPLILNDTVSYLIPYNMFSYRKEDIDIKFFKGILVGDNDICSADDFLHLCRDVYTDALFGEIDNTLKARVKEYQSKFNAKFGKVPKYSEVEFKRTVIETDEDPFNSVPDIRPMIPESDTQFQSGIKWIDSMPSQYKSWSDQDIMRGLLFLGNNTPLNIISKSSRFRSVGTLDNVLRSFRRRISECSGVPIYVTVINGHEYKFNFTTGSVIGGVIANDSRQCRDITMQIKKAMRIK